MRELTAVLLLSLAACHGPAELRHAGAPPNVLLVTIDTLRADRVSAYGYARTTTPFLDQIAREGILFERGYATSSWTVPSVVSLMTGLAPDSHGIIHGQGVTGDIVEQEVIPDQTRLLAELLEASGYRTFAITANGHLHPTFGFARGFDRYSNAWADAGDVTRVARGWRDEIVGGGPWFLWVHYLDPHHPYKPRPRWLSQYHPDWERSAAKLRKVAAPEELGRVDPASDTFAYLNAAYDAEINFVDEEIRKLFALLGVSPADLVVVTADHGEEFLDHTSFGHSRTLFEEQIHVPLLMRLPGGARAGTRFQEPVSLVDVVPTLLAYLGIDAAPGLEGRALFTPHAAEWQGARPIRASLSRDHSLESLRLGRWKYIHDPDDRGRRWLFDLERDPGEQRNLLEQPTFAEPALAALLAPWLAWQLDANGGPRATPASASLTQEQATQLRSLGYLE